MQLFFLSHFSRSHTPFQKAFRGKHILLTCILFFLFAFSLPHSVFAATGDWPTYLHDIARQNNNSDETLLSASTAASLQQEWTFKTNGIIASSATIVGNVVYEGSWDGYEYALNAQTGQLIWKTFLGITTNSNCNTPSVGVTSTPTVLNGVVYVGGGDANWYALDASTGNVLWKVFTGDNTATAGHYNWASPLIYNNKAYIGVASLCDLPLVQGQLLEVDLTTHQLVNTYNVVNTGQIGGGIWTSPAIDTSSNTIFVTTGTDNGNEPNAQAILAIDATTLTLKSAWQIPNLSAIADADWGTSPIVYTTTLGTTMVAAINKNGILYAFNASNLTPGPVWQYTAAIGGSCPQCGEGSISSGAFSQNKLYFAAGQTTVNNINYNGSVRAFNPATGTVLWETGTTQSPLSAIAYANGVVAVGAGSILEVLDANTGAVLFSSQLDSIVYGAPSISNGILYAGTVNGTLYAFHVSQTMPTPTPTGNQYLGGMNLDGYCASQNQGTQASLSNGQWICQQSGKTITLNTACQWQYTNPSAVAQQDRPGDPYSWSCYILAQTPTPTPTVTPTPTPTPTTPPNQTRLGGMNLDGYCTSLSSGQATLVNGQWVCTTGQSTINLTSACQWQYATQSTVAEQDRAGDPYSWSCYTTQTITPTPTPTIQITATPTPTVTVVPTPTPTKTRLGGLDLNSYCQNNGYGLSATITNGNWTCGPSGPIINETTVCQKQYNVSTATAQMDQPGNLYSWSCYN